MTRGGKRPGAGRPVNNDPKKHTIRLTDTEKDFIEFSRIKAIDLNKLKKSLLVVFAMFIFAMPVNALTLKTSVEYTVDSACLVAFENTNLTIPKSEFNSYTYDVFYYSNLEALKARKYSAGLGFTRKLVPFYTKGNVLTYYGVQTEDQPNKKFYYDLKGKLIKYEVSTFNGTYPYKNIAYDEKGKLLNIHLIVSEKESFIFDENKKLIGHWINNQCYDENGKLTVARHL
jgi:hypothetical protein